MKAESLLAHTLFGLLAACNMVPAAAVNTTATASLSTSTLATSAPATASISAAVTSQITTAPLQLAESLTSPPLAAQPADKETTVVYSEYTPLPTPPSFKEAPEFAKLVARGELPPVRERLPDVPAVIAPLHKIGTYGGDMRKLASNVSDIQMNHRLGYEPLVRWGRDGKTLEPGIAKSWEIRDGGKTFVFHLREGMKWSDGHPFTSADLVFTHKYMLSYDGFGVLALPWMRANNKLPSIEAPNPHTVIYRFEVPYGNFIRGIAAAGLQQVFFCPRHYLEQFHPEFTDKAKLDKLVKASGFVTWVEFFTQRTDLSRNPDLPTVAAYKIAVPPPASQCIAVRNPYYWKVDTAGNQLPYIDRIVTNMVFDRTILNLKALNGGVDFQIRNIDAGNFTLFKERGKELGYKTLVSPSTNPTCVYVNQYSRNDKMRPILQDPRLRKAMSHAINRDELVEMVYSGLAKPSSGISIPIDEFFVPGIDQANTEYNPALANKLLDEMGLKRRKTDGLRTLPDGTLFSSMLRIYPSEEGTNADLWQLVVDYWREVGLHFAPRQEDQNLSFLQVTAGNADFFCYSSSALHWAVDGVWKSPISNQSYMAPVYGNYYQTNGQKGVKPSPEMQQLIDWYEQLRATPDEAERIRLGQNILKQWADKCYVVGICRPPVVSIVSNRLRNVPDEIHYDYRVKSPGHLNIEQFYIEESEAAR